MTIAGSCGRDPRSYTAVEQVHNAGSEGAGREEGEERAAVRPGRMLPPAWLHLLYLQGLHQGVH